MVTLQSIETYKDLQRLYDWFDEMRTTQPVWLDESSRCWHVFRYEDAKRVLSDHTSFSADLLARVPMPSVAPSRSSFFTLARILSIDPPKHRLYRDLVSSAFTPQSVANLSGRIKSVAQELIDKVRPLGKLDMVEDIAYPLPATIIAALVGVSPDDWPFFNRHANIMISGMISDSETFGSGPRSEGFLRARQSIEEMADFLENLVEDRRKQRRDDMISGLLDAEVDGKRLEVDEIISFCILFLVAGSITTRSILGLMMVYLDENPVWQQRLLDQPELISGITDEVLRYASPGWRINRVAVKDVEIGGVTIPEGAVTWAWIASANRDPQQFPDPDRFDPSRSPNRHLTFGHGIHYCIGAPLARLEVAIVLPMILEQLPQLRVLRDEPLALLESRTIVYILKHIPIVFTPSKA
ncbi:MAG TPA: cytochrome P450 [Ktedonobacteraceae bacterium]|nr:cytochrome P450 [Ktedonobacteraceae bacterium]